MLYYIFQFNFFDYSICSIFLSLPTVNTLNLNKSYAKGQKEENGESIKGDEENNYIEQFFVGLLEGDGTITTNENPTSKIIRVRFVIALKNDQNNHNMLIKVQKVVGGRVVIERKDKYVT